MPHDPPPGLPRHGAVSGAQLYLRPLEDRLPSSAEPPSAFELIVRRRAEVARFRAPAAALLKWAEAEGAETMGRLTLLLGRISERPTALLGRARRPGPLLMGIVNVTPDSFSGDGVAGDPATAIAHGRQLAREGADILDIGGESTRPGASAPSEADEMARVLPVLAALVGTAPLLSIDTRRAKVMRAAVAAGADIINDISALRQEPEALAVAVAHQGPVVLTHMRGSPETMQDDPRYDCAPLDVFDFLEARIAACEAAGIARARLIVDPGIGFGKTVAHNLAILRDLGVLHGLGCPVLVGASRKGFIGRLSGVAEPKERLAGSLAVALHAAHAGAAIIRVHDVAATRQALALWAALEG
jgi:dihydropteroate synthase